MRKWREKRYKHDEVEVMNFYLNSRTPDLFSVRLIFFIFFVLLAGFEGESDHYRLYHAWDDWI